MQKITPFLWFDHQAEEAAQFYTSTFKNSRINQITRYGEGGNGPVGDVMTVSFQIEGQDFTALNGGPVFTFSQATSFFIRCETQEEVDRLWERLSAGGEIQECGWLIDKFGVTWQIVPNALLEMMSDEDPEKVRRVTQAMLKMKKLDIAPLKKAFNRE
jgi:predicted 3-demethylubiquinone-9 3-methyltransferase (glyoxalase superfamily)